MLLFSKEIETQYDLRNLNFFINYLNQDFSLTIFLFYYIILLDQINKVTFVKRGKENAKHNIKQINLASKIKNPCIYLQGKFD